MIIKKFYNKENGFEVHVAKINKGFSVAIYDTDANEFFSGIKIYKNEKAALKKAKEIKTKGD